MLTCCQKCYERQPWKIPAGEFLQLNTTNPQKPVHLCKGWITWCDLSDTTPVESLIHGLLL